MSDLRSLIPSAQSLLVFEAAARLHSFKSAAKELRVTQPSISHTIRALEDHLGVRLFERGNRGVRLTRAGADLMADLAPALRQIETSLRGIRTRDQQTITIAASTAASTQWLLPLAAEFRRENPDLSIRIITTDRNIEPGDEADLSIRRGPKNWQRKNCWHLSDEVLFPICSPAYLKRSAPIRDLSDLRNHSILHSNEPFRNRMSWQEWLRLQNNEDLELPQTLVLNDNQLVIQACVAGEGIALGWSFTAGHLVEQGTLVRPLDNEIATQFAFYAIGRETAVFSNDKLKFIDWIAGSRRS